MKQDSEEYVLRKLNQLLLLLAIDVTRGLSRMDRVALLKRVGLSVGEIAAALGTSPNAVSVMIYKTRGKARRVLDGDGAKG